MIAIYITAVYVSVLLATICMREYYAWRMAMKIALRYVIIVALFKYVKIIGSVGNVIKLMINQETIYMTKGVSNKIDSRSIVEALVRYMQGDWGDTSQADWQANDYAAENGERILAAYHDLSGEKFWIITEWDRSATTILLPSEY